MLYNMFFLAKYVFYHYLCIVFFMVLDFKVKKREPSGGRFSFSF